MSKLSEYLEWKEIHQRKSEQHADAVKFYTKKIKSEIDKSKEEAGMTTYKEAKELNEKVYHGNTGLGTTRVKTIEDKLSVEQEACNNAYMAVQGIRQAHAEKNGESIKKDDPMWETFTFSDFDKSVLRTWKKQDFKDAVSNASMGLTGEAGEVADLIKKAIYHERGFVDRAPLKYLKRTGKPVSPEDVLDELSDCLFYVSAQAQNFGFTLEEVALHNKAKLEKRYSEGFTIEESAQKKDKGGKN